MLVIVATEALTKHFAIRVNQARQLAIGALFLKVIKECLQFPKARINDNVV